MPHHARYIETTDSMGASIYISGISKSFPGPSGHVPAVDNVSLNIPAGQFTSLLGPSGCGKSTLLRVIAQLDPPTSGSLGIQRHHSQPTTGDTAFVFQDAHLLPWRSVLDNAALPLELLGTPKSTRHDKAARILAQVGLSDAISRYPAQLSGGMRMRVSLARALVTDPQLLLLDEPFAALDEITRHQLDDQLRDLWLRRRMTVLFVTHSIAEAVFLSQRAIVFSRRPARVVLDETITLPDERPSDIRTTQAFAEISRRLFASLHSTDAEITQQGGTRP